MRIRVLSILLLVLIIQACKSEKEILYMQDIDNFNNSEVSFTNATIQPNDLLKISVNSLIREASIPYNPYTPSEGQASSLDIIKLEGYVVSLEQTIDFPILGVISVKGLTTQQLEKELTERLEKGNHLINPKVSVRLLNAKVTLLGEVQQPGTYSFSDNNVSLLQALGLAGDLTINGKREDVILIREIDNTRSVAHINLTNSDWLATPYKTIKPNDVIIVNPNESKVKSAGFIGNLGNVLGIISITLSTVILILSFN